MLSSFALASAAIFSDPFILCLILFGVAAGIAFGSIPGISATMAIALFLPISFKMTALQGMSLLVSIYIGGISGGLISAILLRMPGTPSSVATCFDGAPMAMRGEAQKALGVGIFYSFLGTLLSLLMLIFLSPIVANIALKFGTFEYFSIALFSLTMIASLSTGSIVEGLLAAFFGMLCATIGLAPVDAVARFTFGSNQLLSGIDILPILVGMFALSEIMVTAEDVRLGTKKTVMTVTKNAVGGFGFTVAEFMSQIGNFIRSALIGIGIGILPGLGGSTANLIAYSVAQNQSKHPEKFGTGIIDGVVATESANNASIGGAMVPLLTLGIPGDMATAMLLGGLMLHGLQPGPLLFVSQPVIVYGMFIAMILANFAMLFEEYFGIRLFVKILKTPKHILLPIIFVLCIVGVFGLNNRMFDTMLVIIFGAVGYFFIKAKLPVAPFIMGYILERILETNLRRAMMSSQGSWMPFLTQPISCVFLLITAASLIWSIYKLTKDKKSVEA
ncbi:MAG: tripartite tricarboxylate transporter permease [Synergistaceae bacterium]